MTARALVKGGLRAPVAAAVAAVAAALARALASTFAVVVLSALVLGAVACSRKASPAAASGSDTPPALDDASAGFMLTWIDDKGGFHTELRVGDVPESGRELVMVRQVDPAPEPPSGDRVFVADLRAAGPDGKYVVRLVPRTEFEGVAVDRRKKHGAVLAAQPPASASAGAGAAGGAGAGGAGAGAAGDVAGRPTVIIYGAEWCGPCHQAQAYLKRRGIPFVEYDIERDPARGREMQSKLAKAGVRGGSIPVIDVKGHILVGFSPSAIDAALGQ